MTNDAVLRYDPVDQCIYCGAGAPTPLGDEHIIPYSLNGTHILPKASCRECERIINKEIETFCLRQMLIQPRLHFGLKTRNPSQRPSTLPIMTNELSEKEVPVADHPLCLMLPQLSVPSVLTGEPDSEYFAMKMWTCRELAWDEKMDQIGGEGSVSSFNPGRFARFLAKIAHATTAARLGVEEFKPLLPDIILGRSEITSKYVGGSSDLTEAPKGTIHQTRIFYLKDRNLIGVKIRLFAALGAPEYIVIVGTDLTQRGFDLFRLKES